MTELVKKQVGYCYEALEVFGTKNGGELPLVCYPSKSSFPGCIIPNGVMAYKKSGSVIEKEPMKPGWHWMLPWESVAFMVSPQYTFYDIPVKSVPTKDNVYVGIDVFLVFRILDAYKFIMTVGPEKLGTFLKNAQEETVRSIANSTLVADIYDLILINESEYVKEMNAKFTREYGVEVFDMMVTGVTLPNNIAVRLENETTFGIIERYQKRKQEFDILKTKHMQEVEQKKQEYQNLRLKYEQEQISRRKEIEKELDEARARTSQRMTEIDAEAKRIVELIGEESRDFAQKKDTVKNSILLEIRAQTSATSERLKSDALNYEVQIKSKTDLEVATLNARALKLIGDAEEKATKKLKTKRAYDLEASQVKTLAGLTSNRNLLVQGETGGNLIAQIQGSLLEQKLYK